MRKTFLFLSLMIIMSLACDLSVTVVPTSDPATLPTNTSLPASPTQAPATPAVEATAVTVATIPPVFEGNGVAVDPLHVVIPPGLARGARGLQFTRTDGQNLPYYELTQGHIALNLEGYMLQNKLHEPQIYVYPALPYAELVPPAFESIHRLNNILYDPNAPISADQLPIVPFFNAAQVFASNVQVMSFQNGRGVRFLTEYAQYAAPVNNHELFYHFQGLTNDGVYYVIAILPITMPALAETGDVAAAPPSGGIPYPDISDPNANLPGYYAAVTDLLNNTTSEIFTPNLTQLDQLIQSMSITE